MDSVQQDVKQLRNSSFSLMALLGSLVNRNRRTDVFGNVMLQMFLPAMSAATEAEDRSLTLTELTRVAAALSVYRAREGEYPQQLADLVPAILARMPLDLYSGKPFLFERKKDGGHLLYSVFRNSNDNGGTDISGDVIDGEWVDEVPEGFRASWPEGDLVIRVPVPEFKMPETPVGNKFGP